jgi:anaerobic magnesium-protoporphyrin IX monomethyl ester cyclase
MINRILLIDVDIFEDKNDPGLQHYSHHPIGLLYLIASVREQFPEIEFKVFHTSTSNEPLKNIEFIISSFNPDLVGLRALSIAKEPFKVIAEKIRKLKPDIPIVGGGPYPSTSCQDILLEGVVDIAVIGEGETTFVDLVGRLKKFPTIPDDIKGTAVIVDSVVKINEQRPVIQNIDTIMFPDYDFINLKDYVDIKNHALQDTSKSAFILSSRGCPYGCFYCHQIFGKKIRRRSAENVITEMREHIEKRGIFDFVFLDDIFNVPMPEAKKILSLISEELPKVRISFPNGLRADFIDEEMLDLFEKAGTVEMALAIETVVPRLQKLIGKNLNLEKAEKAISSASKRFITRIFFMVGFPTETFDEALETINFAASFEYAAQPVLSVLRLYNNSKLFKILEPSEEQAIAIAEQEKNVVHLKMFSDIEFYGDFFSAEKVPLKSTDMRELLYIWMRDVLVNPNRIKKSHQVIVKFLDQEKILEFYRSVFGRPNFNENDLQKLLKFQQS